MQDEFRFCPHCGKAQRTKIVEYFQGHPDIGDGGLRVSVYLTEPQHARLSVWRGEEAQAAISLDPHESGRLARFLLAAAGSGTRAWSRGSSRGSSSLRSPP